MAAITRLWVDDDILWAETDDGGDPRIYMIDPDSTFIVALDETDDPPLGEAVWTKPSWTRPS